MFEAMNNIDINLQLMTIHPHATAIDKTQPVSLKLIFPSAGRSHSFSGITTFVR